jgi:2-dehydropantoate 2-reductase
VIDVSPITTSGSSITQLGPPRTRPAATDGVAALTSALTAAGLPCELRADADVVIWTKLAMAATAGPLTAVLGTTVAGILASPTAKRLLVGMFDEIMALAAAEGVVLDRHEVWDHAMATYEAVGPHLTSMAADVAAGRRSEIDSFCVEISRRAAAHGLPTPNHDVVGRLIVAREEERGLR